MAAVLRCSAVNLAALAGPPFFPAGAEKAAAQFLHQPKRWLKTSLVIRPRMVYRRIHSRCAPRLPSDISRGPKKANRFPATSQRRRLSEERTRWFFDNSSRRGILPRHARGRHCWLVQQRGSARPVRRCRLLQQCRRARSALRVAERFAAYPNPLRNTPPKVQIDLRRRTTPQTMKQKGLTNVCNAQDEKSEIEKCCTVSRLGPPPTATEIVRGPDSSPVAPCCPHGQSTR